MYKKTVTSCLFSTTGVLLLVFLSSSCILNNRDDNKNISPDAIYFDYKISGTEGDENVTVLLRYRAGKNGPAIFLENPSQVTLDSTVIPADSSALSGFFYEIQKPANHFTGKHTIVFTNTAKQQYKEEFYFSPLSLVTHVPDTIHRSDLLFEFTGAEKGDYIRLLLNDTSFTGDGISRTDTMITNRVIITKEELQLLLNGPVQLQFIKESENPVKNGTRSKGKIVITSGIKKEFILTD